jgi:hypothetical protein
MKARKQESISHNSEALSYTQLRQPRPCKVAAISVHDLGMRLLRPEFCTLAASTLWAGQATIGGVGTLDEYLISARL